MLSRTTKNNGSIVLRLRSSFLLIFIGLAAFGIFSQNKFADITARKNDLTRRAIPLLVQAQELVALLTTQSQQIAALRNIDTSADFQEIAAIAAAREAQFDESIIAYHALSTDRSLEVAAAELFMTTQTLIDLQTRRQTIARQQASHLVQLRSIVESMEIQIEGLRLDVLTKFQSSVDQLDTNPDALNQIGRRSSELNTLVSLGVLIDQLQNLADFSGRSQTEIEPVHTAEEIRFVFRQVLGLLSRMPASSERDLLASKVQDARTIIIGSEGILQNAQMLVEVVTEIKQGVAVSFEHIQSIETEVTGKMTAASAGTQQTSSLLDQSIRALTVSNLIMILVLFSSLVAVVGVLVESQLNKRLQSLRASARQFAVENYDDQITVYGEDELGEVADSLRQSQGVSRDLKRSNADLQSFAYAASHDLKTPLRAITDLAEWTLEDARDELSDQNRQKLELLSGRSKRLSHLLDGLLFYAQVDGMADHKEAFDLVEECDSIADLLDPEGRFSVVIEPPETAFATASTPLRQILNNLMSNAMKHHDAITGQINIRAHLTCNAVEIQVQDNGPGIPKIYHEKIFELFQKLESADVVEGAGIGLALVKKLAERHGGGVRLTNNLNGDRGTTFSILLSAEPVT